jgi:hypothetical protein
MSSRRRYIRKTAGKAGKRRGSDESDVFYRGAATPTRRTPNKG